MKTLEEAWSIAIGFLYKRTTAMTATAILALLSAGILTWYCIDTLELAEANLPLAKAMMQYGSWVILIFDAEVFTVITAVYKITKLFAERYNFWKTFHVFIIITILSMALLSFGNDLTLALGMNDVWRAVFEPAQTNPILRDILWSQRSPSARPRGNQKISYVPKIPENFHNDTDYHSFTSAVYNGTHLEDFVLECEGTKLINIYPTGNRIYAGAGWKNPYPDRPDRC